jgi:hypothetical protein
VGKLLI